MSKSELENDLEGLEHQKQVAVVKIEFAQRVEKLLANPDFRAVILDEYCVQEAARFVHNSCDPALSAERKADALSMAQAAGHLKRWLQATQMQAEQLVERLPDLNEEIDQARAELASFAGE